MKFPFKKKEHSNIWCRFDGLDVPRLIKYLDTIRDGEEMELIIRKKVSWDVSRMHRFFEGPVVDFVAARYADTGVSLGKGHIREALKQKFLGSIERDGLVIPISLSSLTRPQWIEFLREINDWCMDTFGCPLPSADDTDV